MMMQERVADRTIGSYLESLGGEQAMPGGGSAAGVIGALAAATAQLMASLTQEPSDRLREGTMKLIELRERALECAEADEQAYGSYLEALGLPKSSPKEKAARRARMAETLELSARVPITLAVVAVEIVDAMEDVILDGNKTVLSDADTAIVMASAVVDICEINVKSNLKYIKDEALADDLRESIEAANEMIVHLSTVRRTQIADRFTQ